MVTATTAGTEAAIWERVIHPHGRITPATARRIVQLTFSAAERRRMGLLAGKNQAGELTPDEESELDSYVRVGSLLSILKSRARQVLKVPRQAS